MHISVILVFNSAKGGKLLGSKAFKLVHCLTHYLQSSFTLKIATPGGSDRVFSTKRDKLALNFTIRKLSEISGCITSC